MRENLFAKRLCRKLDRTLEEMPPGVLGRLRVARHCALSHQKREVAVQRLVLPGFGSGSFGLFEDIHFRRLAAVLLVLTALAFAFYWQGQQYVYDLEDIDSALLTDDIPPDAFLDQGFAAWLEGSSE